MAVLAKSYARIAWQNLANFGIVPLEFTDNADYDKIVQGDMVILKNLREGLKGNKPIKAIIKGKNGEDEITLKHSLSDRQVEVILKGGIINYFKERLN